MRKILFFLSSLILVTLLSAGCNDQKCEHLYIISTNDIHSTIDAFPRLATLVAEYETKGEVLLVDAGDRVSGNAYVDDATEPGIPIIDLMNTIGYDVATLGNHEFDKGHTVIDRAIEVAEFPIVCANVKGLNGATTPLRYTIIESCGIEIGFVGVVDTDSEGMLPLGNKSSYTNYEISSDIDTAYAVCSEIAPECDFVVLLSHMGLDVDRQLAERNPACEWIVGGHSHSLVNEEFNGVHISQNNKNIRYATVADITILNGKIESITYEQLSLSDIAPNASMEEQVAEIKLRDPELNAVVGTTTEAIDRQGVINFTLESLATYPYDNGFVPEVVFYHVGGIRIDSLPKGEVKRVDILNNDPFVSSIALAEMTTEQMRRFILDKYNSGTAEKADKESHYIYFASNIPYTIILGQEPAEAPDATDIVMELEEGRTYRVALCNYITNNYIDLSTLASPVINTDITVREAMLRHIGSFNDEGYTPDTTIRQFEEKATNN